MRPAERQLNLTLRGGNRVRSDGHATVACVTGVPLRIMRDMSSDGAMDRPRSARPARGDDQGLARIALGVLLILALVATVVMIFSDNPVWMRIGTLAALWAAFIGAFLVARYRRQAATEASRMRDLHTVYELQLEREISARREHELVVEKDLRDTVRRETADSILGLRHEIAALREQLGALGVTLPEDRFAVGGHAPAGQLGSGSSLPNVPSERVEPRRRAPAAEQSGSPWSTPKRDVEPTAAAQAEPGADPRPGSGRSGPSVPGVAPDATPSTERTGKLRPVSKGEAPSSEPARTPRGPAVRPTSRQQSEPRRSAETVSPTRPAAQQQPVAKPGAASATTPAAATKPTAASAPKSEKSQVEQVPNPERTDSSGPGTTESAPASRHGEGTGLSVAELMARLGSGDDSGGGRRRRRSAD